MLVKLISLAISHLSNSILSHISGIKLFCCVVNILPVFAAGSYYTDSGGGSDYLCTTDAPQFVNFADWYQRYASRTGIEYEGGITPPVFSLENNGEQNLTDLSPLCAVCYSSSRSAHMMFPAMMTCPLDGPLSTKDISLVQSGINTDTRIFVLTQLQKVS